MADALLDDLIAVARESEDSLAKEAADVLASWDRQTLADSRGAALFQAWSDAAGARLLSSEQVFARPWSPEEPLQTPSGLAEGFKKRALDALKAAAETVKERHGRIDVAWGEVVRIKYAGKDLPASVGPGALGSFRVGFLARREDGTRDVVGGNTFVALVEFGDKIRAKAILAYGNATRKDSPHFGDQLELFSQGKMRDVWFYRSDVEAHLVGREEFSVAVQ